MGFEPTTSTLATLRSTKLSYYRMERVTGIEPVITEWKSVVLPSYTTLASYTPVYVKRR